VRLLPRRLLDPEVCQRVGNTTDHFGQAGVTALETLGPPECRAGQRAARPVPPHPIPEWSPTARAPRRVPCAGCHDSTPPSDTASKSWPAPPVAVSWAVVNVIKAPSLLQTRQFRPRMSTEPSHRARDTVSCPAGLPRPWSTLPTSCARRLSHALRAGEVRGSNSPRVDLRGLGRANPLVLRCAPLGTLVAKSRSRDEGSPGPARECAVTAKARRIDQRFKAPHSR